MRVISALVLLMILSACNLANAPAVTEEIVAGVTVIVSDTPLPPATIAPSETAFPTDIPVEQESTGCPIPGGWVAYTVQSGDTLFSIAQRANSSVDALVEANCLESADVLNTGQTLYLPERLSSNNEQSDNPADNDTIAYWLASEEPINGNSVAVGCVSYLTPVETDIARAPSPAGNIQNGLEALFSANPTSPYHSYWNDGFTVGSVEVDGNGVARVIINGDFLLIGTCGDPVLISQVLMIVFSESVVQSALITVDGMNLAQISDMSGRSGADARFTRADLP